MIHFNIEELCASWADLIKFFFFILNLWAFQVLVVSYLLPLERKFLNLSSVCPPTQPPCMFCKHSSSLQDVGVNTGIFVERKANICADVWKQMVREDD